MKSRYPKDPGLSARMAFVMFLMGLRYSGQHWPTLLAALATAVCSGGYDGGTRARVGSRDTRPIDFSSG